MGLSQFVQGGRIKVSNARGEILDRTEKPFKEQMKIPNTFHVSIVLEIS